LPTGARHPRKRLYTERG